MKHSERHFLCTLIMFMAATGAQAQSTGSPAGAVSDSVPGMPTPSGPQALSSLASTLRAPGYVDLLAGLGYTTDAKLTPDHPEADGIALAGLAIDYIHQGPELDLDALGNLERLEYLKSSLPGSFYGEFNGSAIWGHPTELFQWILSDNFGEGMIDPLSAPTSLNLQTINYGSTGPYLNFNFGSSERLTLFGMYSRTTFERSPLDSQGYQGGVDFRHAFSSTSSFSLQATDQRTGFLDRGVAQSFPGAVHGYDTRAAWADYATESGRTKFSASGGYNTTDYGGTLRSAPLGSLLFSREMSPSATLFLQGQTGYSTLGNSLGSPTSALASQGSQSIVETGTGAQAGTAAAAPFDHTAVSLGGTLEGIRTTFTLTGTASEQHYVQEETFNQTNVMANISLRYELGPTLSVQLSLVQGYEHYARIDADSRTSTAHLALSRQFRKAILSAYAQWMQQRSSTQTSTVPVSSFDDERVGIELSYDLIGHRVAGQSSLPGQL